MSTLILPERALSIRQPWASLIIHGFKLIENRKWQTKWRGTIAIHASRVVDPFDRDSLKHETGLEWPLPQGAYLGTAELVDVHSATDPVCCGIWAEPGCFHWRLENPAEIPDIVYEKGKLGLYRPHPGIQWGRR